MEREDDLIELGAASIETKGLGPGNTDVGIALQPVGLADD
ncbi:benenodin family lasso peptide [Novosphingobium sp. M1R2S20]|uniref:Benenodin family lasso peptide n=1 Tax=Novosphingobium rhizovicinum TaxID=3228928 RepID=A0ABV3RHH7_9SPHN